MTDKTKLIRFIIENSIFISLDVHLATSEDSIKVQANYLNDENYEVVDFSGYSYWLHGISRNPITITSDDDLKDALEDSGYWSEVLERIVNKFLPNQKKEN